MNYEKAILVLADGTYFLGNSFGVSGMAVGECCFTTAMSGYQESMTDPSYNGQILVFSAPHLGNVGFNLSDKESAAPSLKGVVCRFVSDFYSNHRAKYTMRDFFLKYGLVGISNVDTRALILKIRKDGPQNAVICAGNTIMKGLNKNDLIKVACSCPSMTNALFEQEESKSDYFNDREDGFVSNSILDDLKFIDTPYKKFYSTAKGKKVAIIDFGIKANIVRALKCSGCELRVFGQQTSFEDVKDFDGYFLSNGPGDPVAVYAKFKDCLQKILSSGKPVLGICMGHQVLALAFNAATKKMDNGHRGINHPVVDLNRNISLNTSQNHGFVVDEDSVPDNLVVTHRSLIDRSIEGIMSTDGKITAIQYHPEACPGPHDSLYVFEDFFNRL